MVFMFSSMFIVAFVSATLWPLASEAVFLAYLHQNSDALLPLLMVASAGNTLGAMLMFELAFRSKAWVERRYGHRKGDVARWQDRLRRFGSPLLALSWLPLVGDFLPIGAGLLKMSRWTSYGWIAVGKTARYSMLSWLVY